MASRLGLRCSPLDTAPRCKVSCGPRPLLCSPSVSVSRIHVILLGRGRLVHHGLILDSLPIGSGIRGVWSLGCAQACWRLSSCIGASNLSPWRWNDQLFLLPLAPRRFHPRAHRRSGSPFPEVSQKSGFLICRLSGWGFASMALGFRSGARVSGVFPS